MKKLFVEGVATNVEEAARILGCAIETARADWALMKAMLNKDQSDWATNDALREIGDTRRRLTKQHVTLHDTLLTGATSPTPIAAEDGATHVPEPVEGYVNLDAVPAVVAVAKLVNEDLKGLQELFSLEHKPEPKGPMIGEKDGFLHVGGDNPIPVESVPKLLKQLAPPEPLDPDDEPTPDDIG